MHLLRYLLLLSCLLVFRLAYAQQDIDFQLTRTFLPGKNVIKIKRDFKDPYLWALTDDHHIYRIHCITFTVDDYSAKFSAFTGQQWIDVAGAGPEHVFIAFDAAAIAEYDNGTTSLLNNNIGINATVNSIGMDAISITDFSYGTNSLGIATSNGLIYYDFSTKITRPAAYLKPSRIYDATYRSYMFHDGAFPRFDEGQVMHYSMFEHNDYTIYGEDILLGGVYGTDLRCAYYTRGNMWYGNTSSFTIFSNTFYGTEAGLIQLVWYNNNSTSPYNKYLSGQRINKISSVFGLPTFTNQEELGRSLGRENLLVGTDAGLYFSNSKYMGANQGGVSTYDFFHYAGLGAKKINDITPNSNSDQITDRRTTVTCEDGVWVAAADGLYLLHASYVGYFDETANKVSAIYFDTPYSAMNEIQTCGAINTKISVAYGYNISTGQVKWIKNGLEIPGEQNPSLNVTQPGEYWAVIYDPCSGLHAETNHLKITQLSGPVFTFNYPDKLNYCFGSTATLQTESNTNYQYRWYKDGALNGNTTNVLTTTQPGKYKLEVSACSGSWTPSKEVEIAFIKVPQPTITPDKAAYCSGSTAVLSASVAIDATGIANWQPYQYKWYKDGVLLNGATASTLSTTQAGKYNVEITACSGNSATSVTYELAPITLATPKILPDKPAYCIGSIATLTTDFVNDGNYTIDWLRNGTVMPLEQNKTAINTNVAANYVVRVSSKLTTCSQASNSYALSFDVPPMVSIQRIVNTTLCDGQTVDLKASYSSGTVGWSTGETTDKITVRTSGIYTATVTTAAGCQVPKDISVQFFPNPVLNLPDATLCQFTNDQLTLTAPAGFAKYEWNGQQGGSIFTTNKLGPVVLTVTDQNGCKATQTLNITSHCNDIHIPNTFTPNGDGINDKWTISGLEGDATVNVKIYNRTGGLVFQSQGYDVPWDSTYNGKKVPAGVYYYVINAKGSNQVLSGSLTVIY